MSPVRTNRVLLAVALDVALTLAALLLATQLRLVLPFGQELSEPFVEVSAVVYGLTALIWVIVLSQFNLYSRRRARLRDELGSLTLAVLTALLILAGVLYMSYRQVSRLQFVYFGAINLLVLNLAHTARFVARSRGLIEDRWPVLIVGAGAAGRDLACKIRAEAGGGVEVIGFLDDDAAPTGALVDGLPVLGTAGDAAAVVQGRRVAEIILALPQDRYNRMLAVAADLEGLPVQVSLVPDVQDLAWFMTRVEDLNGIPILRLRESLLNGPLRAVKRLMDIVLASILLVLAAPAMAVIAVVIRLDSPGPVIIRQKRIGENTRTFDMFKFRTMTAGTEAQIPSPADEVVFEKRPDDRRVTRVGRVLRRFSLDELPQFVNVLRGEMSLVGPRPELPWLVDRYDSWQRRRFAVPPGMTGWWQVNGRSDRPMPLNVEDDLYYIRNYSLWLDIVILLRTIPAVLGGRGAY